MNRILFPIIAVFLILFFSGCSQHIIKTANSLRVNGELRYAPDQSPLQGGVIKRISDGKTFLSDDSGKFQIEAQPGDSLQFSFVGTIGKTVPVTANDTSMTVSLDPYIPGNDEYVVRVISVH